MICIFTAFIFGSEHSLDKKVGLRRRIGITMVLGAFVFPAAVFLLGWLGNIVSPGADIARNIPGKAVFVFEVIFYGAFFITGTLLPLFYALTEFPSDMVWIFKGLKFSVAYFICIWVPVASVMIILGATLPEFLVFLLESFISILFIMVLSNFFFRNFQPTYTSIYISLQSIRENRHIEEEHMYE